jgi:hypothetical protein
MLSRDGWGGLVVLATSLLLFWFTLGLKDSPLVPIGPGFYPRIVLGVTAVLGLWLLVGESLAKRRAAVAQAVRPDHASVLIHFAVFALYVVALPQLGFRLSTLIYVAAANALLAPPVSLRGWLRVALLAFVTTLVAWLVFEKQLSVLLPRGRWTNF